MIHILGDIWSPVAIGRISDKLGGNLTAGMLITVVAIMVSGVLLLAGVRHLDADQRAATFV